MAERFPTFTTQQILGFRPPRHQVDPRRVYAALVESECSQSGEIVDVATLFLSNSECSFHCLMCDLWKNTLERSAPTASIAEQVEVALAELSDVQQIKLYNSGNFFDPRAISPDEYPAIADLVRGFDRVIVENHPKLCGPACLEYRDVIAPAQLEIALGLETVHPGVLQSLNKQMTLADYDRAADFLCAALIPMRTFILLRPPFLTEEEGVEWAIRSIEYAFNRGINCCSLVPTRAGNGIMEQLQRQGDFSPPAGSSMETVLAVGIEMGRGRVFMDLWDAEQFFACQTCRVARIARLQQMNLTQVVRPPVLCGDCEQ